MHPLNSTTVSEHGSAPLYPSVALGLYLAKRIHLVDFGRDGAQVYCMLQKGVIIRPMGGYGLTTFGRISSVQSLKMTVCSRFSMKSGGR